MAEEYRFEYVVSHEAWYWPHISPRPREVLVTKSLYTDGRYDGSLWEFVVAERTYGSGGVLGLWVEIADDAWGAFADVPEFFAALHAMGRDGLERGELDVSHVIQACQRLGYRDRTEREHPGPVPADLEDRFSNDELRGLLRGVLGAVRGPGRPLSAADFARIEDAIAERERRLS